MLYAQVKDLHSQPFSNMFSFEYKRKKEIFSSISANLLRTSVAL